MSFTDIAFMGLQAMLPVLAAALTWASTKLASFVGSKVQSEYLRGAVERLNAAVDTAVKELEQTMVDELKAASADGKISEADQQRIKQAAIANVKSYLGPKGIQVLTQVLGHTCETLDSVVGAKVEAAVHEMRLTERRVAAMAATPTPAVQQPFMLS